MENKEAFNPSSHIVVTTPKLIPYIMDELGLNPGVKVIGMNFDFIQQQSDQLKETLLELRKKTASG